MVTCIILVESMDTLNVSFFKGNRLLANYIGNLPISHFINDRIDCLKIMFKPDLCNFVPEDAYKLDNINVNGVSKSCLISCNDFKNLSSLCSKVRDIQIYNYLDVYESVFRDRDKVVVVDSWSKSLASVLYIEFGQILDFRRIRYSNLGNAINKICKNYNCYSVVNAGKVFDYVGMNSVISNLNQVEKERLSSLRHIQYCFENQGIAVLEDTPSLDWSDGEEGGNSLFSPQEDYYARNLNDHDFNVESDYEEHEEEVGYEEPPRKLGFFEKLFGSKKNKPSKKAPKGKGLSKARKGKKQIEDEQEEIQEVKPKVKTKPSRKVKPKKEPVNEGSKFADENYVDESDVSDYKSRFSQLAVDDSSHASNGKKPSVRKFDIYDKLTYIGGSVFLIVVITFLTLHVKFNGELDSMNANLSGAIRLKNHIASNVEFSSDPVDSPTLKVSQLKSMALPSSFKVQNITYDGVDYSMSVAVGEKDNIDDFSSYLPKGFKLSKIEPKKLEENSKIYDIILAVS